MSVTGDPIGTALEDFMLKTRITKQYGLRAPFINAGMAFVATAPLVRAVCSAGGMGMLGAAAMPPAAWPKPKQLADAARKRSSCKAARPAAITAPARQHSRCCR